MSEPSREHVEAVAYRMCDASMDIADRGGIRDAVWSCAMDDAEAILTSTDPAVLDAMQDALVRAGRLIERRGVTGLLRCYSTEWKPAEGGDA